MPSLSARDALLREPLPLADAVASASARRFLPLVERQDLVQLASTKLLSTGSSAQEGSG